MEGDGIGWEQTLEWSDHYQIITFERRTFQTVVTRDQLDRGLLWDLGRERANAWRVTGKAQQTTSHFTL